MLASDLAKRRGSTGWRSSSVARAMGLLWAALLGSGMGIAPAAASDAVIVNTERYRIEAGKFSPFASFQSGLQSVLDACGKPNPRVAPADEQSRGRMGPEMRAGILRALECDALKSVPKDSSAKDGAITEEVWHAVLPGVPVPSLRDRVDAFILSFEATDFGESPEWNFCQDSKEMAGGTFDPNAPGAVCYNVSDPCSFLTWGPRGATAGQGREIQWILWLAWRQAPQDVERAFGAEFPSVRRFFGLKSSPLDQCEHGAPVERFMCAVWLTPERRIAWEEALSQLGRLPVVRKAYAELYGFNEFDGGKLQAFAELWHRLSLSVTEVDYAFFLDRITHLGGPPEDVDEARSELHACIAQETAALSRNAAARRCLGRLQPHETQPEIRLARDVAFYLDNYPEGVLGKKEVKAWSGYVPLSAGYNFGLSDTRTVVIEPAASLKSIGSDRPSPVTSDLTKAEWNVCREDILFPQTRIPGR